jgi:hypothetical protein
MNKNGSVTMDGDFDLDDLLFIVNALQHWEEEQLK